MERDKISTNIKAALKVNLERKAPTFLLGNIMKQVAMQPKLKVAPPTNYTLLAFGLVVAMACIVLPLLLSPSTFTTVNIQLPQFDVSPTIWFSVIALMLLYAADQFIGRKQLKRILHR